MMLSRRAFVSGAAAAGAALALPAGDGVALIAADHPYNPIRAGTDIWMGDPITIVDGKWFPVTNRIVPTNRDLIVEIALRNYKAMDIL